MRLRLMALAACIASSAPAAAQTAAIDGLWRFDMTSPQGVTTLGAMTVMRNKDTGAYGGKAITNGGVEALPIRSIEFRSHRMTMTVDSARGPVVFRGDLSPSGQSFSGTLTYHDGRNFSMAGVKQVPAAAPK
jgi:hypothetical protein